MVRAKKAVDCFKDDKDMELFEQGLKGYNEMIYCIWKVGLNLALRVSDVLKIMVKDAEDFLKTGEYKSVDKKTGKGNHVKLNENSRVALREALVIREKSPVSEKNGYLFVGLGNRSSDFKGAMTRQTVDRAFKHIVNMENIDIEIGTHTMRKTWGYKAYKKTNNIGLVMKRLNHSSQSETLKYIGITNKVMDELIDNLNL